jgi:DNA-binding response OmpR family regulator
LLLAEDEPEMASYISRGLRERSYAVDVVADGAAALYAAGINSYDLAILDVRLPVKDGYSVCRELRQRSFRAPILMLTALDDPEDVICGLHSGADDYLTKPFDFGILVARIHSLLRRANEVRRETIRVEDLSLNTLDHTASRGGHKVTLTAKEYTLLEMLMLHSGKVLSREAIAREVWDEQFDPLSNVIDVYVNRLRKKLDREAAHPLIHTCKNEGYMLAVSGTQES